MSYAQAPLPSAVAVPSNVPPSKTWTELSASAVPVSVSVLSAVTPSPTVPVSAENESMVGTDGAVVSTMMSIADDAAPVLPATSTATAVKV